MEEVSSTKISINGAFAAIWNEFSQSHSQYNFRIDEKQEDKKWKVKLSYQLNGGKTKVFDIGYGATKNEAKQAARLRFLQAHHQKYLDRIILDLTSIHYAKRFDKLFLEEGWHVEFKGSANPLDLWDYQSLKKCFKENFGKTACGFLNSDRINGTGKMYFGVHDSGTVQGISLTREQKDQLRLLKDNMSRNFDPPISDNIIRLEWKTVNNDDGLSLYLAVICVKTELNETLYWYDNIVYERSDAATLKMEPQKIRKKIKSKILKDLANMNI